MGNKMLIIDGVEYQEWEPPKERHHFEPIVSEHAEDIFGKQSEYFDTKQKLKSLSGIGSIPDGYVIILGDSPHWHVVEVELSSHPPHEHIVPQLHRFTLGIKNPSTQRDIVKAIYSKVAEDDFLKLRLQKAIAPVEIYMFLTDLISQPPILTIIIEKYTPVLREALSIFRDYQTEVVEFQTFVREGVGLAVHAHLFEPVCAPVSSPHPPQVTPSDEGEKVRGRKVMFEELASAGLLKDGQVLYFYHTRPFTDERAQVIASSNQLKYEGDGRMYSKSELAKQLLIKHGFKHDEHPVRGPEYWKTEDGKLLVDLEEQVRRLRGDRG